MTTAGNQRTPSTQNATLSQSPEPAQNDHEAATPAWRRGPSPCGDIHRIVPSYGKKTPSRDPPGHLEKQVAYCFELPREVLELYQNAELSISDTMPKAISNGLRALEEGLRKPPHETFEVQVYDEKRGYRKIWKGSTRYNLEDTTLTMTIRQFNQITRIIFICSNNDIDHRQLYWTTLIKPHAPKGTGQHYKEKLQSTFLPPRSTTMLITACLYSHIIQYQNKPEGQKTLEAT